jgi:hypothetical protein
MAEKIIITKNDHETGETTEVELSGQEREEFIADAGVAEVEEAATDVEAGQDAIDEGEAAIGEAEQIQDTF